MRNKERIIILITTLWENFVSLIISGQCKFYDGELSRSSFCLWWIAVGDCHKVLNKRECARNIDKNATQRVLYWLRYLYITDNKDNESNKKEKNNKLQNNYQTKATRALDTLIHIVLCEIRLLWKTLEWQKPRSMYSFRIDGDSPIIQCQYHMLYTVAPFCASTGREDNKKLYSKSAIQMLKLTYFRVSWLSGSLTTYKCCWPGRLSIVPR